MSKESATEGVKYANLENGKTDSVKVKIAKETRKGLDEIKNSPDFENLKKAHLRKAEVLKRLSDFDTKVKNDPTIPKEAKEKIAKLGLSQKLSEGIEKLFSKIENSEQKLKIMDLFLKNLNALEGKNGLSPSGIAKITKELKNDLDKLLPITLRGEDFENIDLVVGAWFVTIATLSGIVFGTLSLGTFSMPGFMLGGTVAGATGALVENYTGISDEKDRIKKTKVRNGFYGILFSYIPGIDEKTAIEIESLYNGNTTKGKNEFLASLLKNFKENDGVVTKDEVTELKSILSKKGLSAVKFAKK